MDFSQIIQALDTGSSFELFRLKSAIERLLEDPKRLARIKSQLTVGDEVEYFEPKFNKLIKATILEVKRTRVLVKNCDDGERWGLPFYWLNLNNVDTTIESNVVKGLAKNEVHVGETLGFIHEGVEVYGVVNRINPKTVSIDSSVGKWRIPYSLLFKVIDGQSSAPNITLDFDG